MRDDALNASGDDPQLQLFAADTSALCRAYLVQQIEIFEKKMKNKVKKKNAKSKILKKLIVQIAVEIVFDCVRLCLCILSWFQLHFLMQLYFYNCISVTSWRE